MNNMAQIGVEKVVTLNNLKQYNESVREEINDSADNVREEMSKRIEETQETTLKRLNKIDSMLSEIDRSIEGYVDISDMYTKNVMNELDCIHKLLEVQHDVHENMQLYLKEMNRWYRYCFFGMMFFMLIILSIFGFYIF